MECHLPLCSVVIQFVFVRNLHSNVMFPQHPEQSYSFGADYCINLPRKGRQLEMLRAKWISALKNKLPTFVSHAIRCTFEVSSCWGATFPYILPLAATTRSRYPGPWSSAQLSQSGSSLSATNLTHLAQRTAEKKKRITQHRALTLSSYLVNIN